MNQRIDDLTHVVELLLNGSVILCSTDTIWGLSCNALEEQAVDKIYEIKKRDKSKKMILLMDDLRQLRKYTTDVHPRVEDLIIHYTQPLTVIHKAASAVPPYLISEDGTIAVRLIRHKQLNQIISRLDCPIVSTSANIQGAPSPTHFEEIDAGIKAQVDHILHNEAPGKKSPTVASTIIKYSSEGELIFIRE